ncbi:hypothetical protein BDP27DRAFT_1339341 [Rhodocollybia butyracea]|uniref:Uncharacterized protein n=1 Tax=Rhodocollybia butyracea TaxID=206335 RepID=A0A9P5PEH1_9AGAR|nr:hypothetical protein BDP27DRAFT_1339341 [Rhodocollybia butyracea]
MRLGVRVRTVSLLNIKRAMSPMGTSLSTVSVPDWQTACASKFNCTSEGLVNILGEAIFPTCPANGSLPPDVWGISNRACEQSCGIFTQSVDFTSSALTMSTWLLPWLALIAQLPFEANGSINFMSACLSIGSPALAAYSIALTAFNRRYISIAFRKIKETAQHNSRCRYMVERVDAAAFILRETQQCPMRANQRAGELASLIILDDDNGQQKFWITAEKDLRNTRRGFTQSFLAQVLFAFLAYLISFIAAVHDSLGSPDVGNQFASSTVWSWMFPIVFGYVRVGSQCKVGTIKKALTDHKFIPERDITGKVEYVAQTGLCSNADLHILSDARSGAFSTFRETLPLLPIHQRHVSGASQSEIPSLHSRGVCSGSQAPFPHMSRKGSVDQDSQSDYVLAQQGIPKLSPNDFDESPSPLLTWWGFDVRGDERTEGPIFNYARIFTWFTFAGHVQRGFENGISSFRTMFNPSTARDAAIRCRLEPELSAFIPLSTLHQHPHIIHHMFQAALVALFLQWGTTGAAILVAYWTPAVGLGCRSGGYLIYGIAATVSWLMLVFSNLISHEVMQRLEVRDQRGTRGLSALAVITRITGKTLAIFNAAWLIASGVMEDIGAFQTCWCDTDAFQYHGNGWISVFKDASDLRNVAGGTWIGGFVWSMGVCLAVSAVFAYQVNGERNSLD